MGYPNPARWFGFALGSSPPPTRRQIFQSPAPSRRPGAVLRARLRPSHTTVHTGLWVVLGFLRDRRGELCLNVSRSSAAAALGAVLLGPYNTKER